MIVTNKLRTIAQASPNQTFEITEIQTIDKEMKDFLFTLGCYVGEKITVISRLAGNVVIVVKDARYSIDSELANAIIIK